MLFGLGSFMYLIHDRWGWNPSQSNYITSTCLSPHVSCKWRNASLLHYLELVATGSEHSVCSILFDKNDPCRSFTYFYWFNKLLIKIRFTKKQRIINEKCENNKFADKLSEYVLFYKKNHIISFLFLTQIRFFVNEFKQ